MGASNGFIAEWLNEDQKRSPLLSVRDVSRTLKLTRMDAVSFVQDWLRLSYRGHSVSKCT